MTTTPSLLLAGFVWRGLRAQRRFMPLLTSAVFIGMLALLPVFSPFPWRASAAIVGFTSFVALWWVQVEGLLQQNRPMLARLVPGHVAALQRSLVGQWLLFTAGFTALATVLTLPLATDWLAMGTLWAAAIGTGSFVLVWLIRQPMWWLGVALVFTALPVLVARTQNRGQLLQAAQDWAQAPLQALPTLGLAGLLMVVLLRQAIGDGGAAHRAQAAARQRMQMLTRASGSGEGLPVRLQTGFTGAWERKCNWLWRWLLQHSLRQPLRGPVPIGRLNLVLAGPSHWARQLGVTAWLILLFGALIGVLAFAPSMEGKSLMPMRFGLCFALFGVALNPVLQHPSALKARQREQRLLQLLPGVPQGLVLGRAWDAYLTRLFLCGWVLATSTVLGLALGTGTSEAAPFLGGFAAACLPLVVLAWNAGAQRLSRSGGGPAASLTAIGLGALGGGAADILQVAPALSLSAGVLLTLLLWLVMRRPQGQQAAGS